MAAVAGVDFHWAEGETHAGPMAECRNRDCRLFALASELGIDPSGLGTARGLPEPMPGELYREADGE